MKTIWAAIWCGDNLKVWGATWLGFFGSIAAAREWLGLLSIALGIVYTVIKIRKELKPKQ